MLPSCRMFVGVPAGATDWRQESEVEFLAGVLRRETRGKILSLREEVERGGWICGAGELLTDRE